MTHVKSVQLLGQTPVDSLQLADHDCTGKAWESAAHIVSEFESQGKCLKNRRRDSGWGDSFL